MTQSPASASFVAPEDQAIGEPVAWMVTNTIYGSVSLHLEEREARAYDGLRQYTVEALGVLSTAPTTGSAPESRTHITQPGESVLGIAHRECGNEKEWRHILACNPRFANLLPSDYFPVGTVLTLPPMPANTAPSVLTDEQNPVVLTNEELNALTKERFGNMHSMYAEGFRRLMRSAIESNAEKALAILQAKGATK